MESWKTPPAMLEKSMFGGAASNLSAEASCCITCSGLHLIKIRPNEFNSANRHPCKAKPPFNQ